MRELVVETKVQYVAVTIGVVALMTALIVGVVVAFDGPAEPLPPQEAAVEASSFDVSASSEQPETDFGASSQFLALPEPEVGASSRPSQPEEPAVDPRTLASYQRPVDATCTDPVRLSPPASDLASIVAGAEPGTCFTFAAGEYRFHNVVPKDAMTFLGAGRDQVRVVGNGQTENAFHGTADGVNIGRMTLTGFQGSGGQKRQEQGAIRGTSAIWQSNAGQMATDWVIEDVVLSNNYANGVFLGDHFTVRNSVIEGNGVAGLGGSEIIGGLIEANIVRNNGGQQASGYLANGGGMKFTQTMSNAEPLVIQGNEVYQNIDIGIWCDIACNGFEVIGNYIHDQESRAVMIELSNSAVIRDNLMVNTNTWSDYRRDFNAAAVTVGESKNVVVENNYIDGAVSGVIVRQTQRPRRPQESFLDDYPGLNTISSNVLVRNNVVVNTDAMGVSLGATGRGLISDPGSLRFEGNIYDDPGGMSFWWASGDRYGIEAWRSSGRDTGGGSVPPRPSWTLGGERGPLFPQFEPGITG